MSRTDVELAKGGPHTAIRKAGARFSALLSTKLTAEAGVGDEAGRNPLCGRGDRRGRGTRVGQQGRARVQNMRSGMLREDRARVSSVSRRRGSGDTQGSDSKGGADALH